MSDTAKIIALARTVVGDLKNEITTKQDAPETAGTAGQVLGLNASLEPEWKTVSGGGVVDESLSTSSTNPVQNKTITNEINALKSNSSKTDYLTGNIPLDYSKFEIGTISITSNGWTYSSSAKRVRTKENISIHLNKGIQLGFVDYSDYRFYIGWYANQTYYYAGWLQSDFITPVEGDYVILLAKVTEVNLTSINDLLDKFIMKNVSYAGVGIDSPILNSRGVKIIAHRGANTEAPENTIPAFEIAGKKHVWGIETDIWETTDHYFVCIHDQTVDAMTDGTGKVTEKTLAEVQALTIDAGSNIQDYPDLKIPTLEQYLNVCKIYGAIAVIEIKGIDSYSSLVEAIIKSGMESSVLILVWYESTARNIRNVGFDCPIALIANGSFGDSEIDTVIKLKDFWIDTSTTHITSSVVTKAHENHIPVIGYAYGTKNEVINDLEKGIDVATTNGVYTIDDGISVWQGGSY